jgi:hypothetical protein
VLEDLTDINHVERPPRHRLPSPQGRRDEVPRAFRTGRPIGWAVWKGGVCQVSGVTDLVSATSVRRSGGRRR